MSTPVLAVLSSKRKRGPYKRYLDDPSCPIPKQTISYWRKKRCLVEIKNPDQTVITELSTEQLDELGPIDGCTASSTQSTDCELTSPGLLTGNIENDPPHASDRESASDSESVSDGEPASDGYSGSFEPTPTSASTQFSETTGALLLHSLAAKHGLTRAAVSDILEIIRLHMPADSVPPGYRSLHRLFNTSGLKTNEEVGHTLCGDCGELLSEDFNRASVECMHTHTIKFYEIPLDVQIQALFKG